MGEQILDKSYRLASNVEVGKFTLVSPDVGTYADGCVPASGANVAVLGVAQSSIIPEATADFSGGKYQIGSGSAWPTGAIPTSGVGRNVRVRRAGITQCIAAGVIARGDRVNSAASTVVNGIAMLGLVKTINEAGGTLVHELGEAEEAAGQAGDVIRVRLTLSDRHS